MGEFVYPVASTFLFRSTVLVTVMVGLAACDRKASAPLPSSSGSSPASSSHASSDHKDSTGACINACTLMTKDEAAKLLGGITKAQDPATAECKVYPAGAHSACQWTFDNAGAPHVLSIDVMTQSEDVSAYTETTLKQQRGAMWSMFPDVSSKAFGYVRDGERVVDSWVNGLYVQVMYNAIGDSAHAASLADVKAAAANVFAKIERAR